MQEERRRSKHGHFIDFSKAKWRSMFGGRYSEVKSAAIESGLIDTNDRYSVGRFAKQIRLTDEYRTGRFEVYELSRKIRSGKKPRIDSERLRKVGVLLYERLGDFRFHIEPKAKSAWEVYQIDRLQHRDYYANRCDFDRFHSNYTGLPKSTRLQLSIDGDPLVSVDVSNCQPLALGIAVLQTVQSNHLPICGTLNDWIALCAQGQIYEFAQSKLNAGEIKPFVVTKNGRTYEVDPQKWDRRKTKDAFIICLFERIETMRQNPIYQIIERYFPAIADYIVSTKRAGYQLVAHACQRMESKIMIDGVAAEMLRRHPTSPILTIHDEIIVPAAKLDELRAILKSEFLIYGVEPAIKEVHFGNNHDN